MSEERSVAASFIVDRDPIFAYTGWHLAHSLVARGGFDWSDVHVQFTPEVGEGIVDLFGGLGCATHRLTRFGDGKYCNKLAQWDNLRELAAELIVFLDTDMICVGRFTHFLPGDAIGGKVVDLPNPDVHLLDALFRQVGFHSRPEMVAVEASDATTYRANCNGGFYSVPTRLADSLFEAWKSYALDLLADVELLRTAGKEAHVDQIAFCMAVHTGDLPFRHLPSNVNHYVHFEGDHSTEDRERPLAMLHYHNDAINAAGLLSPAGACRDNERSAVLEANKLIASAFNTQLFLEMRDARFATQESPA